MIKFGTGGWRAIIADGCTKENNLVLLLYYYLMAYKGWRGDCVRNNSTTHLLDRVAQSYGQKCHEVPVGFKHISAKMAETGSHVRKWKEFLEL